MDRADDILREAAGLPIEERARIIDSLLWTLNTPDAGIGQEWAEIARRRLAEIRSGAVSPVPGTEVFGRIRQRFP